MIAESIIIHVDSIEQSNPFTYSVPDTQSVEKFTHLSLVNIFFPKTQYQIDEDFIITIDDVDLTFYQGNISFDQIIEKIQAFCDGEALGVTCREYRSPYQNTGKLEIFKDDESPFVIDFNSMDKFFGYPELSGNIYISTEAVNIRPDSLVKIQCNGVQSFLGNTDLYYFTTDQTEEFSYYTKEDIDPVSNKRNYNKTRDLTFTFRNQDGDLIDFRNKSPVYFDIKLFHYKVKYADYTNNMFKKLLKLYVLKNWPKILQQEDIDDIID